MRKGLAFTAVLVATSCCCLAQAPLGKIKDSQGSTLDISRTSALVFLIFTGSNGGFRDTVISRQQANTVAGWLVQGYRDQANTRGQEHFYGVTPESRSGRIRVFRDSSNQLVLNLGRERSSSFIVNPGNFKQTVELIRLAATNDYRGTGRPTKYQTVLINKAYNDR